MQMFLSFNMFLYSTVKDIEIDLPYVPYLGTHMVIWDILRTIEYEGRTLADVLDNDALYVREHSVVMVDGKSTIHLHLCTIDGDNHYKERYE